MFKDLLREDPTRIRGFDGLRALAMTLVFICHRVPFAESYLFAEGIQVFFVLSGYLITGALLRQRARIETGLTTTAAELKRFFTNRAFRIFPAYFTLLLILTILTLLGAPIVDLKYLPTLVTFTTNITFELHPIAFTFINPGHAWSLAVEEQFYLLAAPLFLLISRRHAKFAAAAFIAASLVELAILGLRQCGWLAFYVDSMVNFGSLAIGATLVLTTRDNRPTAAFLTITAVTIMLYLAAITPRLLYAPGLKSFDHATAFLAGLLVWGVLRWPASRFVTLLEWPPIRLIGRISYAFYLWHLEIDFGFAFPALHAILRSWKLAMTSTILLDYAVSLAIALLSWYVLEAPMLRLRDRLRPLRAAPPIAMSWPKER